MTLLLPLLAFLSLVLLTGIAYQRSRGQAAARATLTHRLEGRAPAPVESSGEAQSLL